MKVFLGLGSNLGDRKKNITRALKELSTLGTIEKISALYETPALLPEDSPDHWNKPFFNLAVQMECSKSPPELLTCLKVIEKKIGPRERQRWSPRSLDLDILLCENQRFSSSELKVPHPEIENRSFVLDPAKGYFAVIYSESPPAQKSCSLMDGCCQFNSRLFFRRGKIYR